MPQATTPAPKRKRTKQPTGRPRGRPAKTPAERAALRQAEATARAARRAELRDLAVKARDRVRAQVVDVQPSSKTGAPPFVPTDDDRQRVLTMAGLGLRHDEIALVVLNPRTGLPIDAKTLEAHFERELSEGPVRSNAKVSEALYRRATGTGAQSVTAAIFWLKCRAGWRETVQVEVEVKSGVLVAPARATVEDWIKAAAEKTAAQIAEAAGGGR